MNPARRLRSPKRLSFLCQKRDSYYQQLLQANVPEDEALRCARANDLLRFRNRALYAMDTHVEPATLSRPPTGTPSLPPRWWAGFFSRRLL